MTRTRQIRAKCASSARESCAGIRASFTNDAYASKARHLCTRTRSLPEAFSWPGQMCFCETPQRLVAKRLFIILFLTRTEWHDCPKGVPFCMAEYNLFTCSKSTLGQFSVVGVSRDCDMAVVIGHLVLILLLSVLLPVEAKPPKCNKSKNLTVSCPYLPRVCRVCGEYL